MDEVHPAIEPAPNRPLIDHSPTSLGKTSNYREGPDDVECDESSESRSSGNSESDFQDSVDESSEPGETASRDDVLAEEEPNGRTENDRDVSAAPSVLRERVQDASLMIILSSDEEGDESDPKMVSWQTSTVSNASLKLVYDVKYRAARLSSRAD